MSLQDILARILRTSNPDMTDEEMQTTMGKLGDESNLYPIFGRLDPNNAKMRAQPEPTLRADNTDPSLRATPEPVDVGESLNTLTPPTSGYEEATDKRPTLPTGNEMPPYPPAAIDNLDWTGQKPGFQADLNGPLPTEAAMGDDPFKSLADSGGKSFADLSSAAPTPPTQTDLPPTPDASKLQWEAAPENAASGLPPVPDASKFQWDAVPSGVPAPAADKSPSAASSSKTSVGVKQTSSGPAKDAIGDLMGQSSSKDNEARKANNTALNKRDKWGNLLAGVGGVGDAIENAGVPFGGAGAKGDTFKDVRGIVQDGKKEQGAAFEKGLKDDPNSDISREYQVLLGKFWQKDPKELTTYSAAQIAEQIPAIEKLATIQNQKDMKELQIEAIRANKELAQSTRTSNQHENLVTRLSHYATSHDSYKNLQKIDMAAKQVNKSLTDPTGYGDLGSMFAFMKALDPGSVVMVGEQERFKSVGSIPQRFVNTLNNWATSKSLTPDQRREIASYVNMLRDNQVDAFKQMMGPSMVQAERNGIDPAEINPLFSRSTGRGAKPEVPTAQKAHGKWNPATRKVEF